MTSQNARIYPISNTGFYAFVTDKATDIMTICKYMFSSSPSVSCQQVPYIDHSPAEFIVLGEADFFCAKTAVNQIQELRFNRFTFGSTTMIWSNYVLCPGGS